MAVSDHRRDAESSSRTTRFAFTLLPLSSAARSSSTSRPNHLAHRHGKRATRIQPRSRAPG